MKKLLFALQFILFLAFNFFLLIAGYQLVQSSSPLYASSKDDPEFSRMEDYNPSLTRLNTVNKLSAYCDSLYQEKAVDGTPVKFEEAFPELVSSVVRNRFYHGYSLYNSSTNFMAVALSGISIKGLKAIVIPDDILKYPFAACSQQSIVFMEVLQRKGFPTRKVGFNGKKYGHFCFEVYYNGGWHFFDPDMEPSVAVLTAYNRPGIAFLAHHRDILEKAYSQYPVDEVNDIFPNYYYGPANTFVAPNAILFQRATKFLSCTIWIFFLIAFVLVRKKYLRLSRQYYVRNNRIHIPRVKPGTSSVYYPNYSA